MIRKVAAVLAGMVDIAVDPLPYSVGSRRERPTALEALRGDWERVGKDLWTAMEKERAAQEARGLGGPQTEAGCPVCNSEHQPS